jgi:hypothetical protein
MIIRINSIEHDVVKIHPSRVNSNGETVFNITYKNKNTGKEFRMQIIPGDTISVGNMFTMCGHTKEEMDVIRETLQEKLLGPEYIKLKDRLK